MDHRAAPFRTALRSAWVRTALVLALLLAGAAPVAAGELQRLHARLMPPTPEAAPGGAPGSGKAETPEGTAFVPLGPAGAPARPPAYGGGAIERVGIERLPCYGGCPAFTLIVEADGSFRWTGESGVERLGEHTGTVPAWRLERVLDLAAVVREAGLETSYRSGLLDGAYSYVLIDGGEEPLVVEVESGWAPPQLWALQELILSLLEDATWNEGNGGPDGAPAGGSDR